MNNKNSIVILAKNIKISRDYSNVLSYTEDEMLQLVRANKVDESIGFSFVKHNKNSILVEFNYNECLLSNYIAFQNPDYSNKWFFAFIDDVEYVNDKATNITFTVDSWSTWYSYWDAAETYVLREHVTDDIIGKYTYPEQIETGELISTGSGSFGIGKCSPVICLTEDPFREEGSYPSQEINGVPTGLHYFVVGTTENGGDTSVSFIGYCTNYAETKKDKSIINSIIMVPNKMLGFNDKPPKNYWKAAISGNLSYALYHKLPEQDSTAKLLSETIINKKYDNINGYIPKNKKLFTYPYNYFIVDNNGGSCYDYRYEDFNSDTCKFKTYGDITPGCSIRTIPENYQNVTENNSCGINACKLPVGSWSTDPYINWLTQNGVNVGLSVATSTLSLIGGAGMIASGAGAVAGAGVIASSGISIASTLNSVYQHSKMPRQVDGNTNSGDVTYSTGNYEFTYYNMSIKSEYAKIIDEYFSRFGYKICEVKIPNINTRPVFNYLQIGQNEIIGYSNNLGSIPEKYMNEINNIVRNGVTIWHNHNNIGNYSITNK